MKEKFILHGLKPLSVNSTYYRSFNGVTKTSAANDWTYTIFHILSSSENVEKLAKLRSEFDPKLHALSFDICVFYPKSIFYTKTGVINSKTIDVSNFEKSIVDVFCLKRHFDNPPPSGCQNLNTDDRYVTDMRSSKRPSEDGEPRIEVEIEIKTLYQV